MPPERKPSDQESVFERILSPAYREEAQRAKDKALSPEFLAAADRVRRHGGLKTGKDLLGWDAIVDRTTPRLGDITDLDLKPIVPVPASFEKKTQQVKEALGKVRPGSDDAIAIILAAAEEGIDPKTLGIDSGAIDLALRGGDVPQLEPATSKRPTLRGVGDSDPPPSPSSPPSPSAPPKPPLAALQPHLNLEADARRNLPDVDALRAEAEAPSRARLILLIVTALALVAIVSWWLTRPAGSDEDPVVVPAPTATSAIETPRPTATAAPSPVELTARPSATATAAPTASTSPTAPSASPTSSARTPRPPPTTQPSSFFGPGQWTY